MLGAKNGLYPIKLLKGMKWFKSGFGFKKKKKNLLLSFYFSCFIISLSCMYQKFSDDYIFVELLIYRNIYFIISKSFYYENYL